MARDSGTTDQVEQTEPTWRIQPEARPADDVIEYSEGDVYYASHDMERDGLSTTIALALADVTDVEATTLVSNFSEYADPDAFDRLFRTRPGEELFPGGAVQLRMHGHLVRVDTDGRIAITPDTDDTDTPRL